jgi:hypothetical protein
MLDALGSAVSAHPSKARTQAMTKADPAGHRQGARRSES